MKIKRDSQDRNTESWSKLLKLIEAAAVDKREEFHPSKELGIELWHKIKSLPKEISILKDVKHLMFYGSKLERLNQEIGELESLEKFTPYTSYELNWFPYEITNCKNLKSSTVSTRALFGNTKTNKSFPNLLNNPIQYFEGNKCSICKKKEEDIRFEQYWLSTIVGTDILPLLAIVCSDECYNKIERPYKEYYPLPHKGGILKKNGKNIFSHQVSNTALILDIDGVLITNPPWISDEIDKDGYSKFNKNCVENLNELLRNGKFEIWLSSSRRKAKTISELNEIFKKRGIIKPIVGFIPITGRVSRKEEISEFIQYLNIRKFLIIDDDKSLNRLNPEYKKNLILTSNIKGFDESKLKDALGFLKK